LAWRFAPGLGAATAMWSSSTIARLTPDEKFDPFPLFLALEAAATELWSQRAGRLHLISAASSAMAHWPKVLPKAPRR
jgi:hypothetical protein